MRQEAILVVEDDEEIHEFLRDTVLGPSGYRVLTAFNGERGLEIALAERPDLILLDLMMPRLPGLEFLRELQRKGCSIPTIVLTAYGSEQEILSAFHLGAKDFLHKPFRVEELWAAIENALTEERLRREGESLTQALAEANQRLQQQVKNWATLHDIAKAISSTLEEPEIFRRVVQNVTGILQMEACSLLLVDQETKELIFAVTLQGDMARFSGFRLKPGQGIAGWVAGHGRPLLVPNVQKDPRFFADVDQSTGFQSRSILCVPLKAKGRVIGVLEAINKRGAPDSAFTEEDLEMLTALASWVAVAVENAWLNRATRDMAAATALKQTVTAMAHHINNRLMAFSLELDGLEKESTVDRNAVGAIIASARKSIREVSAVVKALDRLEEIQTVSYVGKAEMLDIEDALKEQLRSTEPQPQRTRTIRRIKR
jgi:DNA-binding response OmpR family regulator